jgi:predicted RNase H-like HicB family nuclease
MGTDTGVEENGPTTPTHITMELSEDGEMWIITDEDTGVTTQGETREHALEMIDDAVAAYKGEAGRPPTDEELRELGIDPEENTSGELPDVLK